MTAYFVKVKGRKRYVRVVADYFRVLDNGALVFRNTAKLNQYPETVHLFANGVWEDVKVGSPDGK